MSRYTLAILLHDKLYILMVLKEKSLFNLVLNIPPDHLD